tara:strand:+ start:2738 stop:3022 length:285 start_codon:yes stop_codon:yes gene_type:complete
VIVLDEQSWSWLLFQNEKNMYLSVVCGSVGIFTVEIELTQAEIASFNAIGRTFIDELASGISFSPDSYLHRKSNFRNEFDLSIAIDKWRESAKS